MAKVEYATKEDVEKIMEELNIIKEMLLSVIPEVEIDDKEKKKINKILKEMEKGKEYSLEEIFHEI